MKLEKERLERERKLKQKQKAKDRVRGEKEKLAAEKEAAKKEARERSEEQLRLQEQQSLAARSVVYFAKRCNAALLKPLYRTCGLDKASQSAAHRGHFARQVWPTQGKSKGRMSWAFRQTTVYTKYQQVPGEKG